MNLKPCLAEYKMCVFSCVFGFAAFAVFKTFPWFLLFLLFHRALAILRSKSPGRILLVFKKRVRKQQEKL